MGKWNASPILQRTSFYFSPLEKAPAGLQVLFLALHNSSLVEAAICFEMK
jgi:hypothetical protein